MGEQLQRSPRVGTFDLEADNLLDKATQVWCGVVKDSNTKQVYKFRPHEIPALLECLDSFDVLMAHNGLGYDWPLLEKLYGYKYKGKKVDTLIMSRLLNPKRLLPPNCPNRSAGPHSVEAWGWRVGRGKPEHNDWSQFSEDMLHRCSEDVEIQELTFKALMAEAKGKPWRNAFLLSFELFENLAKQEQYGWLVDREHLEKCVKQLTRWMDSIDRVITPFLPNILDIEETKEKGEYKYVKKPFLKSGGYSESVSRWCADCGIDPGLRPVAGPFSRINFRKTDLNSGDETKNFLLEQGWEPREWNTDDDGNKTSPKLSKDDPFDGIEGRVGRLVAKRVQCRQRRGIISGLLEIIRPDGRIASSVNTLAVTGRATHRGIVNIPRGTSFYGKQMRRAFICKPGYVIVGTDSDGCQIRMLCGRMNDPDYTDKVLNGKKEDGTDIHSVNMRAAGLPDRDSSKTFFYGFLFGAGDAKTGKIVKGTAARGKQLKEDFLKGLPALGKLVENLQGEWKLTAKKRYNAKFNRMEHYDGVITGLDGRPITVPSEHMILVYLLQSDEAIFMTRAYNTVWKVLSEKYKFGEDFGVLGWFHDEIQIECKPEIAEDVGKICAAAIEESGVYYKIPCPHKGDWGIGRNWFETH